MIGTYGGGGMTGSYDCIDSALLGDVERRFYRTVCDFVNREIRSREQLEDKDGRFLKSIIEKLGELGWLGCGFDNDGLVGGAGLVALLYVELAKGSAGLTLGIYAHMVLACSSLYFLGTEQQKKAWLLPALRGKKTGCFAYAEPGAGADVKSVTTRAEKTSDGYIINGTKQYITNAPFADFMVVVAKTPGSRGKNELGLFYVDSHAGGIAVGPRAHKLGMEPSEMAEVVFEDCRVSPEHRLDRKGAGFFDLTDTLDLGRIAVGAFAVGLARAALDAALSYTRERIQFGLPISKQQYIRFTLAEMATRTAAAWQITRYAAEKFDAGRPSATEASMAKLAATTACSYVCERALHVCGAFGYMLTSPVQRYYRDCKALEFAEGTCEIQRELIARAIGL